MSDMNVNVKATTQLLIAMKENQGCRVMSENGGRLVLSSAVCMTLK